MMTTRTTEIWVGIFIAAGLAALFMLAMKVSNLSAYTNDEGFEVIALYDDASGLKVRSPVTMAGVTIGRVTQIRFEPVWERSLRDGRLSSADKAAARTVEIETADTKGEKLRRTYVAVVTMRIDNKYNNAIPAESDANIYTAGLLGEKYIGIQPGALSTGCDDEELLAELEGRKADTAGKDCKPRYLTAGSVVKKAQGSIVLEKLIARFIDKLSDGGDGKK